MPVARPPRRHRPAGGDGHREYVRAFERPGALRAGFDDYRTADLDEEHDEAVIEALAGFLPRPIA